MARRSNSRKRTKVRRRRAGVPAARMPAAEPQVATPRRARESVEDPLEDWLEDDDDRWLLERDADDVQRSAD